MALLVHHDLVRRVFARVLLAVATALLCCGPMQLRAEEHVRAKVFPGVQHIGLYAAHEQGFFAKRGLSVDIAFTRTSQELRDDLANGRIDVAQSAADNAVAMAEAAGKDVVIIAGGSNSMNHLFVRPEVNSFDDVRGKSVVVDAPDTAYAFLLYKILSLNGVQRSEYKVYQGGGSCNLRFEGIRSSAERVAVMLNLPCLLEAERQGFKNWGPASKFIGPYQGDGVFVMRAWARAHPDIVVKYLQASIEGLRWASAAPNKGQAAAIVVKYLKVDPEIAARSLELALPPNGGLDADARINPEGFRTLLRLREEMQPGTPALKPEKYVDLTYYERALQGLQ